MEDHHHSALAGSAATGAPPSPAVLSEYWGAPAEIRAHLHAEGPLAVLDYWERLRGPRRFPSRADFNPMEVRKYLPLIFMLDVLPDETWRYRVVGSVIADFFGAGNPVGKTPEEIFSANAEVALTPLRLCTRERAPYMHTASASWLYRDRTFVHYTVLLLPFGESDDAVDKVLCVAEFVSEEEAARS
ncbi:MAG: PAS domain-containing protein [Parvibaculum sp.]|uniref:PAS domain-containing protein n=1 Tax=Parvibaculum sp. TaxID=2024848 RepID=UPI0032EAB0C5